jgi:hypothetical protein
VRRVPPPHSSSHPSSHGRLELELSPLESAPRCPSCREERT